MTEPKESNVTGKSHNDHLEFSDLERVVKIATGSRLQRVSFDPVPGGVSLSLVADPPVRHSLAPHGSIADAFKNVVGPLAERAFLHLASDCETMRRVARRYEILEPEQTQDASELRARITELEKRLKRAQRNAADAATRARRSLEHFGVTLDEDGMDPCEALELECTGRARNITALVQQLGERQKLEEDRRTLVEDAVARARSAHEAAEKFRTELVAAKNAEDLLRRAMDQVCAAAEATNPALGKLHYSTIVPWLTTYFNQVAQERHTWTARADRLQRELEEARASAGMWEKAHDHMEKRVWELGGDSDSDAAVEEAADHPAWSAASHLLKCLVGVYALSGMTARLTLRWYDSAGKRWGATADYKAPSKGSAARG